MGIAAITEGGIQFLVTVFALEHGAHILVENNALPELGLHLGKLFVILNVLSHSYQDLLIG